MVYMVYISRTSVLVGCIIYILAYADLHTFSISKKEFVWWWSKWGLYEVYMPSINRQHDGQVDWKFV